MGRRKYLAKTSPYSYLLFLLPGLILYLTFFLFPILQGVKYSLYDTGIMGLGDFVGLENYKRILFMPPLNKTFYNALQNNVVFFIYNTVVKIFGATLFAVMLNSLRRGSQFYKTFFFIPVTLSTVVVGYLWGLLLNPSWGPINQVLRVLGLSVLEQNWLGDPSIALYTVASVGIWKSLGFFMLIVLSGIISIPEDYYEAARIDGASAFRMHWSITLPLLKPTMLVLVILNFVGSFESFDLIYALTGPEGGPYYSTDVLGAFFYRTAFSSLGGFGLGATIATLIFLIVFPISGLLNVCRRKLQESIG